MHKLHKKIICIKTQLAEKTYEYIYNTLILISSMYALDKCS